MGITTKFGTGVFRFVDSKDAICISRGRGSKSHRPDKKAVFLTIFVAERWAFLFDGDGFTVAPGTMIGSCRHPGKAFELAP
jgi:hypothetical protein